jgi:hypothetical protein
MTRHIEHAGELLALYREIEAAQRDQPGASPRIVTP